MNFLECCYNFGVAVAAVIFIVSGLVALAAGIVYLLNPHKEEEWE